MKPIALAPLPPPEHMWPVLRKALRLSGLWQKMGKQERADFLERGLCYDTKVGRVLARGLVETDKLRKMMGRSMAQDNN